MAYFQLLLVEEDLIKVFPSSSSSHRPSHKQGGYVPHNSTPQVGFESTVVKGKLFDDTDLSWPPNHGGPFKSRYTCICSSY